MAVSFHDNTEEKPLNYSNINPQKPKVDWINQYKGACLTILVFDDWWCPTDEQVIKMNELK
jgi:hypothetical protein